MGIRDVDEDADIEVAAAPDLALGPEELAEADKAAEGAGLFGVYTEIVERCGGMSAGSWEAQCLAAGLHSYCALNHRDLGEIHAQVLARSGADAGLDYRGFVEALVLVSRQLKRPVGEVVRKAASPDAVASLTRSQVERRGRIRAKTEAYQGRLYGLDDDARRQSMEAGPAADLPASPGRPLLLAGQLVADGGSPTSWSGGASARQRTGAGYRVPTRSANLTAPVRVGGRADAGCPRG